MLLRERDRQTLLEIVATLEVPVEIWAFGSRVNGTAHSGSDLDLVLRTANLRPLPPDQFAGLISRINNSNIPILVELKDWALLPESFHRNIEHHYEVQFSSIKSQA